MLDMRTLHWKCRLSCLLSILVLMPVAAVADTKAEKPPIVILFSNSANGILRSCYCPNAPWGGLAKRAWFVERVREYAGQDNVLLLDGGDLFPAEKNVERALVVMQAFSAMDYDGVAIGDQELMSGLAAWQSINQQFQSRNNEAPAFPWLCAGYRILDGQDKGRIPTRPWMVKSIGGYRVGIVSVVGTSAFRFAQGDKLVGIELTDPVEMIREFVATYRQKTDLVVVLSHQGLDADRELAESVSGVDLIVGGHSQSLLTRPELVNGVIICQAGKNGENLGIIILSKGKDIYDVATEDNLLNAPANPEMQGSDRKAIGRKKAFEPYRARHGRWRISHQLVPLDVAVDEDPETAKVIDRYYEEMDRRIVDRLATRSVAGTNAPGLVVTNPVQCTVIRAGEKQQFEVAVSNAGSAVLDITKVRSKIRWLKVLDFPKQVPSGGTGRILLELTAVNIDRFFRSEFTITSNDKKRIVVKGSINGRVDGPMPGIIDVAAVMHSLESPDSEQVSPVDEDLPLVQADNRLTNRAPVLVEFFYAAGCAACKEMRHEVLPELMRRFGDGVRLLQYDIYDRSSYLHLATLQETLKVRTDEDVSVFVDRRKHFDGLEEIRRMLFDAVKTASSHSPGLAEEPGLPVPVAAVEKSEQILISRFRGFSVPAIALAGLIDGINPCAFATVIFFVTLLSVSGRKGKDLLVPGSGFCIAVFLTYLLLGFGVFRVVLTLSSYDAASAVLRWSMVGFLLFLAILSFKDAWIYHSTGSARNVTLQLSDCMKQRIHDIMRQHVSRGNLLVGSFCVGVLVTVLESVCTGQVYVPTLVYLARRDDTGPRAMCFLLLYNLMFVVPLVVVFMAAVSGSSNKRLVNWSRRNVTWSKVLLALFFVGLAVILSWF